MRARQIGAETKAIRLPDGGMQTVMFFTAKDLDIQIGSSILSADEALIQRGRPGELDEVQLSGNVRLKTALTVKQ